MMNKEKILFKSFPKTKDEVRALTLEFWKGDGNDK